LNIVGSERNFGFSSAAEIFMFPYRSHHIARQTQNVCRSCRSVADCDKTRICATKMYLSYGSEDDKFTDVL